jgi:head-tail adaptor
MQTSFFDSRRNTGLTDNFYPQTCTIQQYTAGVDSHDQPTQTWANLTDHVDLPCSIALSSGREVKGEVEYGVTTHRIALNGVYPLITRLMRAVIAGVNYDIQYASPPGYTDSVTVLECTLGAS